MWAKIPDDFAEEPRHLELGPHIAPGVFLRIAGMCHCAKHLTDGFIHEDVVPRLTYVKGVDNLDLAELLVSCGVWERCEDGFRDVDYLRWNPSAETYRSWSEAGKKGGLASWEKRQAKLQQPSESSNDSLNAGLNRTSPVPSPSSVSDPAVVSTDADSGACLDALTHRFPTADRRELSRILFESEINDGLPAMNEAVKRTLARARKNPARYLQNALQSVRAGD